MNKGFSLLEFVVATSLFCIILLAGYAALDSQKFVFSQMELRTVPEQKSNYRILILRNLLQDASTGFCQDGMTDNIPHFFTDLNFGMSVQESSFSIALPKGPPHHFERDPGSGLFLTEPAAELKPSTVLALGGPCGDHFCWNFAKVKSTGSVQGVLQLNLTFLITGDAPQTGSLILVEINGFQFTNNTLYWISPAGQAEPFWPSLDDFSYEYSSRQLKLSWKSGQTDGRSVIDL